MHFLPEEPFQPWPTTKAWQKCIQTLLDFPPETWCVFGYLFCVRLKRWMWVNVRALGSFITSWVHVLLIINPVGCVFLFVRSSIHFKRCGKWWKWMSGSETWAGLKAAPWVSRVFCKSLEITWHRIICKLTLSWCMHALLAVFMGAKFVFASFFVPSPVFIYSVLLALSSKTIHDSHMLRRQDIRAIGALTPRCTQSEANKAKKNWTNQFCLIKLKKIS